MRIPGAKPVHLWGQRRIKDASNAGQIGYPVWDVDKGYIDGFIYSNTSRMLIDGVWLNTTVIKLMCPSDSPIAYGDVIELDDSSKYYLTGDPQSWTVPGRKSTHHLEIVLSAKEQ